MHDKQAAEVLEHEAHRSSQVKVTVKPAASEAMIPPLEVENLSAKLWEAVDAAPFLIPEITAETSV